MLTGPERTMKTLCFELRRSGIVPTRIEYLIREGAGPQVMFVEVSVYVVVAVVVFVVGVNWTSE